MALTKEERELIARMVNAYSKRKILAKLKGQREQNFKESGEMDLLDIEREAIKNANDFADHVLQTQRISRLN